MLTKIGNTVMHVLVGGPILKISSRGKIYDFEMHPYCGPYVVGKRGEALDFQPLHFLKAASLWAQQGARMEDDLCRWDHEPEPITQHLGGNNWKIIGYREPEKGS